MCVFKGKKRLKGAFYSHKYSITDKYIHKYTLYRCSCITFKVSLLNVDLYEDEERRTIPKKNPKRNFIYFR